MRTYTELLSLKTFEERFKYLSLDGEVGRETFGFERFLNQKFYHSDEWKAIRNEVILRDDGNDLGSEDHPIAGRIIIHHMNAVSMDDIVNRSNILLDPEYLISVSHNTHNAIHYSDDTLLEPEFIERSRYDTCPWRR